MVPLGYYTLRELQQRCLLRSIEAEPAKNVGDILDRRVFITNDIVSMIFPQGDIQLFVERDGAVYRIPYEDLELLYDYLDVALWTGYLPNEPWEGDGEDEKESTKIAEWLSENPEMKVYCGTRPLVNRETITSMCPIKVEEPAQRSGAPGRPSSMHLVLMEHLRRVEAGEACDSRTKEAKALVGWLRATHPTAHPLTWNTVRNALPDSFQPNTARK